MTTFQIKEPPVRWTAPAIAPLPEIALTEEKDETCFVYGTDFWLTECCTCDRRICEAHTHQEKGRCQHHRDWCPVCWAKKRRGEL